MQAQTMAWRAAAHRLRALQRAAGRSVSCGSTPRNPRELNQRIATVERCYGMTLPPSYRDFLETYDGWSSVFAGACLLSCHQLLDPARLRLAEVALEEIGAPPWTDGTVERAPVLDEILMPIGLDDTGSILFALDPSTTHEDGEMAVMVWVAGIGLRLSCFAELFDWLCELQLTALTPAPAQAA